MDCDFGEAGDRKCVCGVCVCLRACVRVYAYLCVCARDVRDAGDCMFVCTYLYVREKYEVARASVCVCVCVCVFVFVCIGG